MRIQNQSSTYCLQLILVTLTTNNQLMIAFSLLVMAPYFINLSQTRRNSIGVHFGSQCTGDFGVIAVS